MSFINKLLRRFIKFIGSLKLALGLELLIGFIIAIGAVFFWLVIGRNARRRHEAV